MPLEHPGPGQRTSLITETPRLRGQLLRIFYTKTCKTKSVIFRGFHPWHCAGMCWEERQRAFWSRLFEVPWTLAKGARVLVLFTVETVGGRLRGKEEEKREALPSTTGPWVPAMNAVPFFPPRMPQEGKLDFSKNQFFDYQ